MIQELPDVVTILKACNYSDDQACNVDHPETDAASIVQSIKEKAILNLPGYEEAPEELI